MKCNMNDLEKEVIELNGDFPNTKATVFFASAGQKQLLLKFAKLQLIKN